MLQAHTMKKTLQIGNLLSVIFAITANALVATSSSLPSIAIVSDQYSTLLNPARYAFSIWSLIFILISLLALYQARDLFSANPTNKLPRKMSGWFVLANAMNGVWTYVFISDQILLSVIIISTLLFSLVMLIRRLDIAVYDAPLETIALVWWPLLLYTGWVLVAVVVNIASLLTASGIAVTQSGAVMTLLVLGYILAKLVWTRNLRSLALASIWGIIAIGVNQYGVTPSVSTTAISVSTALVLVVSIHAYQNKETNPAYKLSKKLS